MKKSMWVLVYQCTSDDKKICQKILNAMTKRHIPQRFKLKLNKKYDEYEIFYRMDDDAELMNVAAFELIFEGIKYGIEEML